MDPEREEKIVDSYFDLLNVIRRDPSQISTLFDEYISKFEGKTLTALDGYPYNTVEGKKALFDLFGTGEALSSCIPLTRHPLLDKCASDHAAYLSRTGKIGHKGEEGSPSNSFPSRLSQHGIAKGIIYECISVQFVEPKDILFSMLLGDGDKDKTDQKALLSHLTSQIGMSIKQHQRLSYVAVIILVQDFTPILGGVDFDNDKLLKKHSNVNQGLLIDLPDKYKNL